MDKRTVSKTGNITSEAALPAKLVNNLLKINEDLYNCLPEFFMMAKKYEALMAHSPRTHNDVSTESTKSFETETRLCKKSIITPQQLKIIINKVNSFIFHCSVLCSPLSLPHSVKIDVNELAEILKILEAIQKIFLQAMTLNLTIII